LGTEADLVEYWLKHHIEGDEARHIWFIDKNRHFYEPAIRLKERLPDPAKLAVVPIIHALHTRNHMEPGQGRENANYAAILRHIRRSDAIVTMTEAQREDLLERYGAASIHAIGHAYDSRIAPLDFSDR